MLGVGMLVLAIALALGWILLLALVPAVGLLLSVVLSPGPDQLLRRPPALLLRKNWLEVLLHHAGVVTITRKLV